MAGVGKRSEARPMTTKAGTRLDADYEQRLAEEAERGFDAGTLTRRVGRPSLSGRAGHSHRVDLRIDDGTYAAIRRLAEDGDRKVSDIVRDAIRRYLEAS